MLPLLRRPWFPYVLALGLLTLVYQLGYLTYPPVPGNNPEHPLGWWGWEDQGLYLRAAQDLLAGRFDPAVHFYPPFYSCPAT